MKHYLSVLFAVSAAAILSAGEPVKLELNEKTLSTPVRNKLCSVKDGVLNIRGIPSLKRNDWLSASLPMRYDKPAGKKFIVKADIRATIKSGYFHFCVREIDAAKKSIRYDSAFVRKDQDWKTMTVEFTALPNTVFLECYFIGRNLDADSFGEVRNVTWQVVE